MGLLFLTIPVSIIQLWWTMAYVYAYMQLKEPLLMTQVAQGVAFGLLFVFISLAIVTNQPMSGIFSGVLLLVGLVMGFIWRRRNGVHMLIDYYPRAILDVMLFRKPVLESDGAMKR